MKVDIIPAKARHLGELREICLCTFSESYERLNTPENFRKYVSDSFNSEQLLKELKDAHSFIFLMRENDRVLGYLKLNINSAQTENFGDESMEIERIYVLKECQGSGLGKLFLEKSRQVARKKGKKFLWLGVWERNDSAIKFYESQGFEKFSEHGFMLGYEHQIDFLYRLSV